MFGEGGGNSRGMIPRCMEETFAQLEMRAKVSIYRLIGPQRRQTSHMYLFFVIRMETPGWRIWAGDGRLVATRTTMLSSVRPAHL